MKPEKLSVSELLRLACIYAEDDRQGFADAYAKDTPERAEALDLVRQLRAYRLKRWGKTKLESALESGTPTPVAEITKMEPWQRCTHEWGSHKALRYPDTSISYGSISVCKKCRARCFENYTAMRTTPVERILPPEEPK
jgi:hypothetical protein